MFTLIIFTLTKHNMAITIVFMVGYGSGTGRIENAKWTLFYTDSDS